VSTWLIPVSVLPVASATGRVTLYPYQWAMHHPTFGLGALTVAALLLEVIPRVRRVRSTSRNGSPS
jgi:hypothetical protein